MKTLDPSLYSSGTKLKFSMNYSPSKWELVNFTRMDSNFYYWLKLFFWYTHNQYFDTDSLWMTFMLSHSMYLLSLLLSQPIFLFSDYSHLQIISQLWVTRHVWMESNQNFCLMLMFSFSASYLAASNQSILSPSFFALAYLFQKASNWYILWLYNASRYVASSYFLFSSFLCIAYKFPHYYIHG